MKIHHHYDQLTDKEREFVDTVFDGKHMYELADRLELRLANDDRIERAVDGLARAVIESRKEKIA